MSVNKVILVGNLGRDPEVKYTQKQMAICNLNIATTEKVKDASGNWGDHTEWHRVVTFGKTAENCSNYLAKGRQIYVEGRLRTNKWQDKNGVDKYTTEVIADKIQFLGKKSDNPSSDYKPSATVAPKMPNLPSADEIAGESSALQEDDIPF